MANSFGGSIKLTGESEYRKALKDITGDMRLMASEMKVMATSTDASGKASDADKARKEALTKALADQRVKLAELNSQLEASKAQNGTASDATKRLQTQVNNTTAELNKMESQLNNTGKETGQLGTEMDGTGKKASIFGDVLKASLASSAIIAGVKGIVSGIASIGKAFGGMVVDSIKAYANFEQLVGGVQTLFGDSANVVQKNASQAYKTAGISANQYMEQATSFSATLLQGLSGDTKKASEYADMAIKDMSDNANKMGTDVALIQNAYQGFAKDNYTMLDNLKLGYGGTATEMARLMNDSGVLDKGFKATAENVKDIPFDKLIEGLHKTQEKLGITGTTAKEASSTISGSFNAVKASWENVLVSFGSDEIEDVQNAIAGLVETGKDLVTNIMDVLPLIVDGIGLLVQGLVEQLPSLLEGVMPSILNTLEMLLNSISNTVPKIVPIIVQLLTTLVQILIDNLPLIVKAGVDLLVGLITGIADAIPQLIPTILTAIQTIILTLLDNLPLLIESGLKLLFAIIEGLANALPILIEMLPKIIQTIIEVLTRPDMIVLLVGASIKLIIAIVAGLISAIPLLVTAIFKIGFAIGESLVKIGPRFVEAGGNMVKGLWGGISDYTGWILEKIKGFGKSVLNGIKSFFGIKSPSTLFRDEIGTNLALGLGEGFGEGMKGVSKDMQDAIPTSFDTDINLNSSGFANSIADANSLTSQLKGENLVGAMQEAFKSVKVVLDDKPLGNFVVSTVEGAVYG